MTAHTALAPLQGVSDALVALAAGAAPSLVSVRSHRARSSGFLWRPGLIVTADEALADGVGLVNEYLCLPKIRFAHSDDAGHRPRAQQ